MKGKEALEEAAQKEGPAAALRLLAKQVGAPVSIGEGTKDIQRKSATPTERENQLFFLNHEAKAIDSYELDMETLKSLSQKVIVGAGEHSRGYFPYICSDTLARRLGKAIIVFPGDHAGFLQQPQEFYISLMESLL